MISLDNAHTSRQSETASLSSNISSVVDSDKSTLSFSDLLKGITVKGESKDIQNGVVVLALDEKAKISKDEKTLSKKDSLLSLLKNDEKDLISKDIVKSDSLEINPKVAESLSANLTIKEVKSLIYEAKKYLKEKIVDSEAFKKSDIKDLPKTLKGLMSVAEKLGVDISKITLQEVQGKDIKTLGKEIDLKDVKQDIKDIKANKTEEVALKDIKADDKQTKLPKEVLTQPIFKEVNKKQFSTEQLIQAREVKEVVTDKQSPKSRADETLRSLLSGDKTEKSVLNTTTDISVATAKVIMPDVKSGVTKGLESLLRVESNETNNKIDALATTVHKAESLEVKLNEAKQMVKYLSQDVKQAIDDYKSPFTRIKVQLNPQRLGDVDLTVIQRGKNLIVNLSSNNTAINTLAMNLNELKTQLNNTGINNATFNFNSSSQSEQQNSSGQQHRQNEREQAQKEYNYFDNEEQNEEVLSSLEIVVPNYA